MAPLLIRRLEPDDIEPTVEMWERSRWDSLPWLEERMGYTHADNLGFFRNVVVPREEVWIALQGAEIVGLLALSPGVVERLYVDPTAQGKGVGSTLLEKAKQLMPAGLELFTHQRNERARAFYEKRGFRAIAFGISPAPESEPDVKYAWS